MPKAEREIAEIRSRLERLLVGSTVTAGDLAPGKPSDSIKGGIILNCDVDVHHHDDVGRPVISRLTIGTEHRGQTGWYRLTQIIKAEPIRARIRNGPLTADPVMARMLDQMRASDRIQLLDHLRRKPQTDGTDAGCAAPNWSEPALRRYKILMPPRTETIHVQSGMIVGRVRLAHDVIWNEGRLRHRGVDMPLTVIQTLVGRRLGDVVAHPDLPPDLVIEQAAQDGRQGLRLDVGFDGIEVR